MTYFYSNEIYDLFCLFTSPSDRKWCAPVDPRIWTMKSRTASSNIQQLCDDRGCNPEDLPEAMNDRETWSERVRDIRASRTSWWWDDDFSLVSLCLHEWYFMATWLPTSDDLFCALTLSCWPILYMTTFFDGLFCTHPPLFTYILYVPPLHDLICTVVTFMANFIYFFLVGFSLHIFWLYVHVLLVTYAVHIPPIGTYAVHTEVFKGLFSISPCSIYSVHLFVCTSVIFTSYFVYFVLLGELIFTWHIYYLHVPLVTYSEQKVLFNGLFCTHTPPCWSKIPIYDVFSIFTSPWWAYFYIYNARMSGDLICTPTLSWWPILYT